MAALVAEHPVGAGRQPVQQPLGAQEVHVGEGGEEEQPFDAGREADEVQQELAPLGVAVEAVQAVDGAHPAEAELGLAADRGDVLHGGEGGVALGEVGHVVVQQREVELHVQRLLVELPRQVHARLGGVDVLVQIQHQVVRDDRVAGGEERHESLHQVPLGGKQLAVQVDDVVGEVHLVHRPSVLDGVAVHLVEDRVAHRPQRQLEARVEQVGSPMRALAADPRRGLSGRPRGGL